jgi:hypothetical protein
MIIKLNKNQFVYLNDRFSEQEALRLKEARNETQFIILEIDEETADKIRDWASDELQRKGFDKNYELTSEGKMLEELIDLFYLK